MSQNIDFSECEREPIRTPGFIQSHGCLIAFGKNRRVLHASENVRRYLAVPPESILNMELSAFCSEPNLAAIERSISDMKAGVLERLAWQASYSCEAWLHLHADLYLLELEDSEQTDEIAPPASATALQEFLSAAAWAESVQVLAQKT